MGAQKELCLAEVLRDLSLLRCRLGMQAFASASGTVGVARFLNASVVTPEHAAGVACVKTAASRGKDPNYLSGIIRLRSSVKPLPVFQAVGVM